MRGEMWGSAKIIGGELVFSLSLDELREAFLIIREPSQNTEINNVHNVQLQGRSLHNGILYTRKLLRTPREKN